MARPVFTERHVLDWRDLRSVHIYFHYLWFRVAINRLSFRTYMRFQRPCCRSSSSLLALEANLNDKSLLRLLDLLSIAVVFISLYAWAQWMDLGISHILNPFYSGGAHDEGSTLPLQAGLRHDGQPQLSGRNHDVGRCWVSLAALFKVGNPLQKPGDGGCFFNHVRDGGLRYGLLIDSGLVLILFCPIFFSKRRLGPLVALAVMLPIFGLGFTVANANQATFDRLVTLDDPLKTDSLSYRVDNLWRDATDEFSDPLFLAKARQRRNLPMFIPILSTWMY